MSGPEPEPVPGTVYVAAGPAVGKPADLPYRGRHAATAHCGCGCGQMLSCAGRGEPWVHTGRMPGDPG